MAQIPATPDLPLLIELQALDFFTNTSFNITPKLPFNVRHFGSLCLVTAMDDLVFPNP